MERLLRQAKGILVYTWKDFFEYRAYLLFWILMSSASFFAMYFLWMYIYKGNQNIAGYALSGIITYYLLVFAVKEMTVAFHDWNLITKINNGRYSHFLFRPLTSTRYYLFHNIGEKSVRIFVLTPVVIIMWYLVRDYFVVIQPELVLPFALSVAYSFILRNWYADMVGAVAFWSEKAETIIYFKDSMTYYLSGAMIPLAFFGPTVEQILKYLPFRYMVSFPIEIYLGKLSSPQIFSGFIWATVWLIAMIALNKVVYHYGLKRFSAVGN